MRRLLGDGRATISLWRDLARSTSSQRCASVELHVEGSKTPKPSLPFVWPIPVDRLGTESDGGTVPFAHVTATASSIAGIASDINDGGVTWLEEFLGETERKALIVIAVYAGCPTRSEHLTRLLELQSNAINGTEFRILPMAAGPGAPANCLTLVSQDGSNPVCVFGATPNFGIPDPDPTQFNIAFRAEPALEDKWCSWFDSTWARAAPLTESTAKIPGLIPAAGSADAAAQWTKYCRVCSKPDQRGTQQKEESETSDRGVEDSTPSSASKTTDQQPPSASVGLHRLDPLTERVTRLLGKGQQVTVVYAGAIGPLDVPINARFFNQDPEKWRGTVVRRQSFRISAFSEKDQKMIDAYRNASRTIINKLALPLEKGLYWMPYEMIPVFKKEIAAAEAEAKENLNRLVSPYTSDFIEGKRTQIEHDLWRTYQDIGGQGDLPSGKLTKVLNLLEGRIQNALESNIVTPVSFYNLTIDLRRSQTHEAPWKQMEKLILALARFPREIISRSSLLQRLTTDIPAVLEAMDVESDALLPFEQQSREKAVERADRELELLGRIASSDIAGRDRCEVYLMIIDGKSNAEIHKFINKNRSGRRPN